MISHKVPFVNLPEQYRSLRNELLEAFDAVGQSGDYILGEPVTAFEQNISSYIGTNQTIGVGNGSDALFLIMKGLGIGPGDEVITAANSFIASAWAIVATGAKLVLCDVCDDLNIDPVDIKRKISERTKAIIPVHLTGRPAKMREISSLANGLEISIIEDAAQAIGAEYFSKKVGSLGTAAAFSLHPLKNLGVYGDGGFITTSDPELARTIRLLRNHGLKTRDECVLWGYNSRLDSMQASFASIKLKYLDKWNNRNREIAEYYSSELKGIVELPLENAEERSVYHNYVIRFTERDELIAHMERKGVEAKIHYPVPIHLQAPAKKDGYKLGDFPNSERLSAEILSLPIYPELSDTDVQHVASAVKSYFG